MRTASSPWLTLLLTLPVAFACSSGSNNSSSNASAAGGTGGAAISTSNGGSSAGTAMGGVNSNGSGGSGLGGMSGSPGLSAGSSGGGMGPSAGGGGSNAGGAAANAGGANAGGMGGTVSMAGGGGAAGCVQAGTPGNTGVQCDPGTDGNGSLDQMMPPGDTPPEAVADPKGTVTSVAMIHSDVYGYDYSYQLYIPAEYQAGKPAALMIFQDGGNYMFTFRSPSVFDSLIASSEMPVTISAYINPGAGNERSVEYDATTPKYATFLINEFIPNAIANAYDIVDDPNGWAIGGHSSGGSCAFTAGWNFPDKFHKIMTHSGSFLDLASDDNPADPGAGAYVDLLTSTLPIKPLRVTLLSSPNDLGNGKWFQANNDMATALQTAGYPFRYMKGMGTHDPRPWDTYDYPDALRWLWRGYTLPQYDKAACDNGCSPVTMGAIGNCGAGNVEWLCQSGADETLFQANCTGVAVNSIRYCCPATFLSQCQ